MSKPPIEQALASIQPSLLSMANQYAMYGYLDAADLMQDASIKIWMGYGSFNPAYNFPGWALTVARNSMTDAYRRSRRVEFVSLDAQIHVEATGLVDDNATTFGEQTPDTRPTVEESIVQAAWVQELLRCTDTERAQILVLMDMEGWTEAEVSAELGIPPGTVKTRKYRAKAQIRAQWAATQAAAGV